MARPPSPLDPKAYLNAAMDLVDFTLDPGVFTGKVDFVAEVLAHEGVGAEGVQGSGYDGGFLLLVVEEGEEGEGHGEDEEGEGFEDLGGY